MYLITQQQRKYNSVKSLAMAFIMTFITTSITTSVTTSITTSITTFITTFITTLFRVKLKGRSVLRHRRRLVFVTHYFDVSFWVMNKEEVSTTTTTTTTKMKTSKIKSFSFRSTFIIFSRFCFALKTIKVKLHNTLLFFVEVWFFLTFWASSMVDIWMWRIWFNSNSIVTLTIYFDQNIVTI